MLSDFISNGIPGWVLLGLAAGLFIYAVAWVWTHLSGGQLLGQNLLRSNRVELPGLGRPQTVPASGSAEAESTALVLSRAALPVNAGGPVARDFSNVIYPVAGRNGLHFSPDRCTSCGLCVYICPTGAVTTRLEADQPDYLRQFDLAKCVFCGLCESACPTSAIRLTLNAAPTQLRTSDLRVTGRVEAHPCGVAGHVVPQPDLLADRIYELQTFDSEADVEYQVRLQQAVNPAGICLACQKRVLEAEERICG